MRGGLASLLGGAGRVVGGGWPGSACLAQAAACATPVHSSSPLLPMQATRSPLAPSIMMARSRCRRCTVAATPVRAGTCGLGALLNRWPSSLQGSSASQDQSFRQPGNGSPHPCLCTPPRCSRGRHCSHGGGGAVARTARAALCRHCGGEVAGLGWALSSPLAGGFPAWLAHRTSPVSPTRAQPAHPRRANLRMV